MATYRAVQFFSFWNFLFFFKFFQTLKKMYQQTKKWVSLESRDFWASSLAQKMSKEMLSPLSRRPHHNTEDSRNCFPNPNSFNRTETLILSISFDYSYHFLQAPCLTPSISACLTLQPQLPIYFPLSWHIT